MTIASLWSEGLLGPADQNIELCLLTGSHQVLDAQVKLQHFLRSYDFNFETPVESSKFQIKLQRLWRAQSIACDSFESMSHDSINYEICFAAVHFLTIFFSSSPNFDDVYLLCCHHYAKRQYLGHAASLPKLPL